MDTLETAFGVVVIVLAALAVIGALVFAVVWEVCAIRRTLADHRQPDAAQPSPPSARYWREHAHLTVPEQRP
jgi:hypothetical protein